MPKKQASFRAPGYNPDNVIQYSHDPFNITLRKLGVKIAVSEFGKVTITKDDPDNPQEFDEITVPASVIYKIAFMLDDTRRTESVPREDLKREG
jgi:glucuronate isomerase